VEIADPQDLVFDGKTLSANGKKMIWCTARAD